MLNNEAQRITTNHNDEERLNTNTQRQTVNSISPAMRIESFEQFKTLVAPRGITAISAMRNEILEEPERTATNQNDLSDFLGECKIVAVRAKNRHSSQQREFFPHKTKN